MQDNFTKLTGTAATSVLNAVNAELTGMQFTLEQTMVMVQPLDFYPGYHVAEIADFSQQPPIRRTALYRPKRVLILDGTTAPLYMLNREGILQLGEDTVVAYAKFFLNHVRGPHGAFKVVESLDDISWREEPAPPIRKSLNELMERLRVTGKTPDGGFVLVARLLFGDSLFAARLTVSPDGTVRFDREELLREELPVRDEVLGQ